MKPICYISAILNDAKLSLEFNFYELEAEIEDLLPVAAQEGLKDRAEEVLRLGIGEVIETIVFWPNSKF